MLALHHFLNKPMSKASALGVCRLMELLKCIQYTFHRRALLVAEYLLIIINHYELGLLSHIEAITVSSCTCVGGSNHTNVVLFILFSLFLFSNKSSSPESRREVTLKWLW